MATKQLGLLDDCTGFDGDPAGPWGLVRGGLVRNLRGADEEGQTLLDYSRDGEQWSTFCVSSRELKTGDVAAIRADLLAPKPVPEPPAGATRFVWCYRGGDDFHYVEGKRPETYRSTFWVPTRWHSCHAFDEQGEFVGYFSPHYAGSPWMGAPMGWRRPEDYSGSWIDGLADSPHDAAQALRRSR